MVVSRTKVPEICIVFRKGRNHSKISQAMADTTQKNLKDPETTVAPSEPFYEEYTRDKEIMGFVQIPGTKSKAKTANQWQKNNHSETPQDAQFLGDYVTRRGVKSLAKKTWVSDEIISYCSINFNRLFCGEKSQNKTKLFPIFLWTNYFNP